MSLEETCIKHEVYFQRKSKGAVYCAVGSIQNKCPYLGAKKVEIGSYWLEKLCTYRKGGLKHE